MRITKSLLLFGALFSVAVGSVDCVNGQTVRRVSFADAPRLPFESAEASQPARNHHANTQPAVHVAKKQPTASKTVRHTRVTSSPVIQPASYRPAPALVTLGVNDDLRSIVNNAKGVVLIDFYADWCGPCRTQSGILHDMEQSASQNQAKIIKINIDQHRQLARSLNVSSLPTLMLVKDGQIVERLSGVANHQRVASLLAR